MNASLLKHDRLFQILGARRIALAAGMLLAATAACAQASSYPTRPISAYVPVAAGGAADAVARAWAAFVGKELGTTIVVENKPGANGSIAAAFVAKQPADGYALLFGSTSNMSINPFSYKTLSYSPTRDFTPVTMLAATAQVLVANAKTGIKSVQDLVAAAKAKPGTLNYGSAGVGNSTHLNVAFLARHFDLQMNHIPYKGAAPAMMDLVGGQTDITADALSGAMPQIRLGKVVPLVVFSKTRVPQLPDTPTIFEIGATDYPSDGWYGLMAPKGTSPEIVQKLTQATRKFWADPAVHAQMAELYMTPPAELGGEAVARAMQREATVWGPIVQSLGIRNED